MVAISTPLRSAAVRSLRRFVGQEKVREALEAAARTDADPMVRKAAADLLETAAG